MDLLSAALLGLVQALTEFLPVSSSGHLVLGEALLGVNGGGAAFEVAVHFGTLLSVVLVFRRDIARLVSTTLRALTAPSQIGERWRNDADLRLAGAIVLGCVPAGLVGVLFKDRLEAAFDDPRFVCGALLVTGAILLASRAARPRGAEVTLPRAATIGAAQAVAILPGISRSGSTIAAALFLGVDRDQAARYSFLLSLPVIFGATLLKARDLIAAPPPTEELLALAVGAGVSFVAGIGALVLLLRLVSAGWFSHFGWYCLAVGLIGLIAL
ncbi:MAG: undecaprenyl-diphosphate phosphatase [Myxococcales bacterium]|nr:undecaprenyl-diphosphate phosphatase [Myxococcales bacterium]